MTCATFTSKEIEITMNLGMWFSGFYQVFAWDSPTKIRDLTHEAWMWLCLRKKSESNIVFVFSHVFPISNLLGNKFVYTYTFPQTVCPHWGVLTVDVRCKRPGLDQGAPSGPRLLNCKFSHTSSLVRCSRALRLRRLAQNGCPVLLLSEGRFTSMPCSFFLSSVHLAWRVGHPGHFEV